MGLKNVIREITPPFIWKAFKKAFEDKSKYLYECPVCKEKVNFFLRIPNYYLDMQEKYQFVHSVTSYETINSSAYTCPHCNAPDRSRLYALYLEQQFEHLKNTQKKYNFLEIAPDKTLSKLIKKRDFIKYRSADLHMEGVDDKIDITDMNIYEDNNFDMILCSHVLEHIEDDRKAMSELYRIMKPGGFGILMVPVDLALEEDFEDLSRKTDEDRWKYFGQYDHVRIYSKKGYVDKLIQTGFKVNQLGIDYFSKEVFNKNGISERSVLYIVEK